MHPGQVLGEILRERGVRQREIARRAGISESFLSDVLHGRRRPSLKMLARLAVAMELSPAALFERVYGDLDPIAASTRQQAGSPEPDARKEAAA